MRRCSARRNPIQRSAIESRCRLKMLSRYFDNSLDYDSPEASRLSTAVRQAGITAVIGGSERSGSSLYMGQWIIGADGRTIAARRKLRPTHVERAVFGEGDGRIWQCIRLRVWEG